MSLATQVVYFMGDKSVDGICMVYAGTQGNVVLASSAIEAGPFKAVGHGPVVGIVGFVDFPFSLVMDTALLPMTVGESIADALADPALPRDAQDAQRHEEERPPRPRACTTRSAPLQARPSCGPGGSGDREALDALLRSFAREREPR